MFLIYIFTEAEFLTFFFMEAGHFVREFFNKYRSSKDILMTMRNVNSSLKTCHSFLNYSPE